MLRFLREGGGGLIGGKVDQPGDVGGSSRGSMMPKTKGFRSVSNVIQDPRGGPVGVTPQGSHDSEI